VPEPLTDEKAQNMQFSTPETLAPILIASAFKNLPLAFLGQGVGDDYECFDAEDDFLFCVLANEADAALDCRGSRTNGGAVGAGPDIEPEPQPGIASDPTTIARGYFKRGWNPIPISRQTKRPIGNGWQHRRLSEETVARVFNRADMNVGVQMGPMSGGLTDIDLDCREAVMIGPMLLPESGNVFGRASKPRSHWLYGTTLAAKIARAGLQFKDADDGTMMLELRIGGGGKGAQSLFPGSTHTSGEAVEWERDGALVTIDDDMLLRQVGRLAVAVMLARHWPAETARHDAALTVGGFLARAGFDEDDAALMVEAVTEAAGDEEVPDRVQAARDAVKQYSNGKETRGFPKLVEAFGEKVANKVAEWLGYQGGYKPDNGLPVLVIGHEPTAVAKDLAKLIAQGDHYFFNGNAPVRIAVEVNDMPRAIEVTPENVRVLAHEICNPVKRTNQGIKPAEIKTDVANIYLNGLEGRWGLKHFAGIATTPILSGDGSIRSMEGYDPTTGLWCHNIPALNISNNPTRQEAEAALLRIRHTFRTFPFADAARMQDRELGVEVVDPREPAGLDESAFLVAMLTAGCRPSLQTAPGFLCDAPSFSGAGTGKGLLVKANCIIASGAPPHAFTSGHDASELDKRLTAALIQARPAIFLDNFNAKELSSDTLASALTENPAQVRIMGQTKMVPLHVCTFIGITGNGVEIAEDMARRLVKSHLDARMENPEERKFKPGFLDNIRAQRPSLLSDLLTIWRWARQNPNVLEEGRPLGSYEIWAQWVRDPLLTLGLRDPVERIAEIKKDDPKRRTLIELFDLWHAKHGGVPVRATELDPEVIRLIDVNARTDFDHSFKYSRQKVARFLTQRVGTHVGGYVLTQSKEGPESKEVAVYTLIRRDGRNLP
jgi:Bifunctional DNA primase/polymerase, N-terminal